MCIVTANVFVHMINVAKRSPDAVFPIVFIDCQSSGTNEMDFFVNSTSWQFIGKRFCKPCPLWLHPGNSSCYCICEAPLHTMSRANLIVSRDCFENPGSQWDAVSLCPRCSLCWTVKCWLVYSNLCYVFIQSPLSSVSSSLIRALYRYETKYIALGTTGGLLTAALCFALRLLLFAKELFSHVWDWGGVVHLLRDSRSEIRWSVLLFTWKYTWWYVFSIL